MPYLTAVDTQCTDDGAGLIEGDPEMLDSAGVYGKPTHAQHVYLPYYEGEMLLTRKCVPSVCLWSFSILAFMIIITPLLCTTSVGVKNIHGNVGSDTLPWLISWSVKPDEV